MITLVSLEDACVLNPKKSEVKTLPSETEVTFLGMKDVSEEGAIDLSEVRTIDAVYKGFTYFKEGDILFAKITPCMENGKGGLAVGLKNRIGFGSTEFHVLRTKENVHNAYINHLLKSQVFRKQAELQMTGSAGQKRVPVEFFKNYKIPLPPLEEQKKIAAILDEAHALRQKDKILIAKYEELTQSLFLEMFGDPETNPEGWELKSFEYFAKFDTRMTKDFEKYAKYPHIGIANIEKETGRLIDYKLVEEEGLISGKYIFGSDHIIYSKIRPNLNKVALPNFSGLGSADSYPLLIKRENTNRIFFAFLLRSNAFVDFILGHSTRTNIPKANKTQMKLFKGYAPPVHLQNQFAERIQNIEKQKQQAEQSLQKSEELFNSLLQRAFKGELTKIMEPA